MENSSYMVSKLNRIADPQEFDGERYRYLHPAITAERLQGQHPIRAWEYSQALRALDLYMCGRAPDADVRIAPRIADIGSAGSHFYTTLLPYAKQVDCVDPSFGTPDDQCGIVHTANSVQVQWKYSLEQFAAFKDAHQAYDAVFCLSVIEHVKAPQPFLDQLCSLVCPGGILVLTCDCGADRVDTYHFRWMREWIASADVLELLVTAMLGKQFLPLGALPSFTWRGPTVYDYSVASLAFRKAL